MGELLLTGWLMSDQACPDCAVPIMKHPDGVTELCCSCESRYLLNDVFSSEEDGNKPWLDKKEKKLFSNQYPSFLGGTEVDEDVGTRCVGKDEELEEDEGIGAISHCWGKRPAPAKPEEAGKEAEDAVGPEETDEAGVAVQTEEAADDGLLKGLEQTRISEKEKEIFKRIENQRKEE